MLNARPLLVLSALSFVLVTGCSEKADAAKIASTEKAVKAASSQAATKVAKAPPKMAPKATPGEVAVKTNPNNPNNPKVLIETTKGNIELELFADKAPISVTNFKGYVKDGAYNGTIFHRVISNFMIQGGGFDKDLKKTPTKAPITNEASNGVSNTRGTIAMARTNAPNSATNQFFINVKDNANLNPRGGRGGYAVFGRVTKGMDTVDAIRAVATGSCPPQFRTDCPKVPIIITKVSMQ